jgi:hypothetical protein
LRTVILLKCPVYQLLVASTLRGTLSDGVLRPIAFFMKQINGQQIALTFFIFLIALLCVGSAVFKTTIWVGAIAVTLVSTIVLLVIGRAITR